MWPLIYDQFNHGRHEKELEFYKREFKNRRGKVLEIVCGTGMIFLELLSEGIDIYGFDISDVENSAPDHPDQQGERIKLYYKQKNDLPEQIQNIIWKRKFSYTNKEYLI